MDPPIFTNQQKLHSLHYSETECRIEELRKTVNYWNKLQERGKKHEFRESIVAVHINNDNATDDERPIEISLRNRTLIQKASKMNELTLVPDWTTDFEPWIYEALLII